MNKSFILLICFLGLASLASAASECTLSFGETSMYKLDASDPILAQESQMFYEMSFEGTCRCKLVLYTGDNFQGQSLTYRFKNGDNSEILASDIWDQQNNSYKISCCF